MRTFYLFLGSNLGEAKLTSSFECETQEQAFALADEFVYDRLMSQYDEETSGEFDEFDFVAFMQDNEVDYYLRSENIFYKNFQSKKNDLREVVFGS
jgi:hypothetical protein